MTEEQLNEDLRSTELDKLEADYEVPFDVPLENPPKDPDPDTLMEVKPGALLEPELVELPPVPPIISTAPVPVPAGIYKALVAIMREIGPVARDAKNKDQGYFYRSAEAILNRCHPLFAQYGVFMAPKVLKHERIMRETKRGSKMVCSVITVEYTFFHEDGSSVSCLVIGEGADLGDKAAAKAMTYAQKAAICQILNLPYAAVDPESHAPEWAAKANGRVTEDQLTKLKKAWLAQSARTPGGPGILNTNTSDTDAVRTAFSDWAVKQVEQEFDPLDFKQWTRQAYQTCEGALA